MLLFLYGAAVLNFSSCTGAQAPVHLQVSARHLEAGESAAAWLEPPPKQPARWVLRNASGKLIWRTRTSGRTAFTLPRPGRYQLSASAGGRRSRLALTALAPPPPWYGGVLPVQELGLPEDVSSYLRAHGFEVESGISGAPPRLIVLARSNLSWKDYQRLWQEVAQGSNLLLLSLIEPEAAPAWPLAIHLTPWNAARCDANFFSVPRLARSLDGAARATLSRALRPQQGYDLRRQPMILPLSLGGRMLAIGRYRAPRLGCRPLFSFRFGRGLATISTLPVLADFSSAWDRLYFMNLLKAAARRHPGPATPGLAYVMRARLKKLAP